MSATLMTLKNAARPDGHIDAGNSISGWSGYRFKDEELLQRALTHRSLVYEAGLKGSTGTSDDNEQLEFVGDAVLGLVVAEFLFRRFPDVREGELTRLRASIVSRRHLGRMALQIDLGRRLRLGKGEERSGGRSKSALLSNALEAVIAAVFLDGGLKAAADFVERIVIEPALPELILAVAGPAGSGTGTANFSDAVGDHKSALQEHLQAVGAPQPEYVLISESGPDHRKRFQVEVRAADSDGTLTVLGTAEGSTKKVAQQEAARIAFAVLMERGSTFANAKAPRAEMLQTEMDEAGAR